MDLWQKSTKLWFINLLGLILLLLKMVGIPTFFGYFTIFCITLWQLTFTAIIISSGILVILISGLGVWLEDREKK